ncbi:MAG: 3-phosphoserine/phosphohydroxythreonine transaminase [Acidobacteria bacterium]|nr:3-phosphoserine/phosphohydroxythreonine transaminase [Acidobacteriota bacterium]
MEKRIFNFSAGPAVMPDAVLQKARDEMLSVDGSGMSVMELSHRSEQFKKILEHAEQGLRLLLKVPNDFRILFIQGGASLQFAMIPLNLISEGSSADFILTGVWGRKAFAEAERFGRMNIAWDSRTDGRLTTPGPAELTFSPSARYIHYVANETIEGVEFHYDVDGGEVPVICDMSSNIMSKPIDWNRYAFVYAGAQKNIGPSGIAVAFVRDGLFELIEGERSPILDYRVIRDNGSMVNTPNTWAIYMIGLVCDHVAAEGGIDEMRRRSVARAKMIYDAIDASGGFYIGYAEKEARSLMNVAFHLPTPELDKQFCAEALANGMSGLAGHRSLGGIRASIYNAMPVEGVVALADLMQDFLRRNG